jgi:hypothetical protein
MYPLSLVCNGYEHAFTVISPFSSSRRHLNLHK